MACGLEVTQWNEEMEGQQMAQEEPQMTPEGWAPVAMAVMVAAVVTVV